MTSPVQANLPTVLCSPMLATHHLTTIQTAGVREARVGYLTDVATHRPIMAKMGGVDRKLVYGSWYQENPNNITPYHFVGAENGPGVLLYSQLQSCLDKQLQPVSLRSPGEEQTYFNIDFNPSFSRVPVNFEPFAANGLAHDKVTSLIQGAQLFAPLEKKHLTVHTIQEHRKSHPTYLIVINKMRLLARWQFRTNIQFVSAFYYSGDNWHKVPHEPTALPNKDPSIPGDFELRMGGGEARIFGHLTPGIPGLGCLVASRAFSGNYYADPVKQPLDFLRENNVDISELVDSLCDLAWSH